VTDGKRIVSYFGSCGLLCYDLAGNELWKFELPAVNLPGEFGSGVSPILADGTVILVRDHLQGSSIIAVDAATGSRQWERPRQSPVSYCTPVAWDTPGGIQIVAAGHARMIGYDLKSGEEKWSLLGIPSACCSSPMTVDGVLYFAGGSGSADDAEFQMPAFDSLLKDLDADKNGFLSRDEAEKQFAGFFDNQDANKDGKITRDEWEAIQKLMAEGKNAAFALRAGGVGDVTDSALWKQTKGLPYVPSAILYRGQLVMVKDGGIVTAYDARTGDQIYMQRGVEGGRYYASPVAANGNIYFTSLEDGVVTVLKAGTDQPELIVKNPALGERVAATPAIADDTLYLRTDGHLYAFAEKR
jgi:outer membrane protein assembly factor BamB